MSDETNVVAVLSLARIHKVGSARQVLVREYPCDIKPGIRHTYAYQIYLHLSEMHDCITKVLAQSAGEFLKISIDPKDLVLSYVGQDLENGQLMMFFQMRSMLGLDEGSLKLTNDLFWCKTDQLPDDFGTPSRLGLHELCRSGFLPPELVL